MVISMKNGTSRVNTSRINPISAKLDGYCTQISITYLIIHPLFEISWSDDNIGNSNDKGLIIPTYTVIYVDLISRFVLLSCAKAVYIVCLGN